MAGPAEPPRIEMEAPDPQAHGHDVPSAALSPLPSTPQFTAARERFWVPSEAILLHFYRVNSAEAGLYDEERDLLSVDPQIVREAWLRDDGLRAELVSQAAAIGRTDVVELLERDRAASIAELWRYYSPAAYAEFLEESQ